MPTFRGGVLRSARLGIVGALEESFSDQYSLILDLVSLL